MENIFEFFILISEFGCKLRIVSMKYANGDVTMRERERKREKERDRERERERQREYLAEMGG